MPGTARPVTEERNAPRITSIPHSTATFYFFPSWRNRLGYYLYLLFYHPISTIFFFFLIRWQEPWRSLDELLFRPTASWQYPRHSPSPEEGGCARRERGRSCAGTAGLSWPRGSSTPACGVIQHGGSGNQRSEMRHYCHGFLMRGDHFNLSWGPRGFEYLMSLFPSNVSPNALLQSSSPTDTLQNTAEQSNKILSSAVRDDCPLSVVPRQKETTSPCSFYSSQ